MAPHLHRLDVVTQSSVSLYALSSILLQEVKSYSSSSSSKTRTFEESSILRELLSISTIVESENFSRKVMEFNMILLSVYEAVSLMIFQSIPHVLRTFILCLLLKHRLQYPVLGFNV